MNIWGYICLPFGYLIKWCYDLSGSYALALFIFALVVKAILFPFGVKQQKNSLKQARLRPKEAAIRKKYAGRTDQATSQKMQQEIMEFYQKEGYNPAGGCLPLLIQMPIILALYHVVQNPLTYISRISTDIITKLKEITAVILNIDKVATVQEIQVISEMSDHLNADKFAAFSNITPPDMTMFGINLANTPSWETLLTPIILIPLLVLITGYLQQFIIQKLSYNPSPEATKQMQVMNYVMPLMSVWFSFILPAALGLYWAFQNILTIAQQFIISKVYPIPVITEEEMREAEREYKSTQKQHVKVASKRRSLVYDDDTQVIEAPTKEIEKSEKTKETPIAPAPLKDNDKKD